jgi:acyl-CoA dehydrogenase
MRASGVEIRPINTIGGDHELNQIFFDNVRVPAGDLVGREGQGWDIAKFLLEYERGGDIMSAAHRALLREVHEIAVARGVAGQDYLRSAAAVAIDIDTLEAMEAFVLFGALGDPAVPSILKLRASEIQQAVTELGVAVLGADAVRWVSRRPLYAEPQVDPEHCFVSRYLNSRACTIFGGAREIQKTLIARTIQ